MATLAILLLVGLSIWLLWPTGKSKCSTCSWAKDCTHKGSPEK